MAQLTQEHFDTVLSKLATKEDLRHLATKADVSELEERLNLKLNTIHELLDVRNRVDKLERDFDALKLQLRHQH